MEGGGKRLRGIEKSCTGGNGYAQKLEESSICIARTTYSPPFPSPGHHQPQLSAGFFRHHPNSRHSLSGTLVSLGTMSCLITLCKRSPELDKQRHVPSMYEAHSGTADLCLAWILPPKRMSAVTSRVHKRCVTHRKAGVQKGRAE